MWLVIVFFLLVQYTSLAQNCNNGVIVDAVTGSPIAGATVVTSDRMTGTYANRKGEFRICPRNPSSHLIISSVGYQTDTINTGDPVAKLRVKLQPTEVSKQVVVVTAPMDGKHIVRRVAQRMERLRGDVERLRYSLYSLAFREQGTKSIRWTAEESVTDVLLTTDRNETTYKILDRRALGGVDTTDSVKVWDEEIDLSSSMIVIRGVRYPYPLRLEDLDHYTYEIVERDTTKGGRTVVEFEPTPRSAPGFKGKVVLREADTVFLSTDFDLVNERNLPYVDKYHIEQTFNPELSRLWFPVRDVLTFDVQFWLLTGISKMRSQGRNLRTIVDVEFDPDPNDTSSQRPDTMSTVIARSDLTADEIDSANRTGLSKPRTSAPKSLVDGVPIPLFGTTLSILPVLYRSEDEKMGYGAWLTTPIDSVKVKVAFGSSQDDEHLYGAGLNLSTWVSKNQQLLFSGQYLSSPISIQRDHVLDRTIIRSWLSTAYPEYYSFVRAERADVSVVYLSGPLTLGTRTAWERYSTERYQASGISGSWIIQDLDFGYSTYPSNTMESVIGIPLRFASRLRAGAESKTSQGMFALYTSLQTSIPILETGIGAIRLGIGADAGTTSMQTPIQYLTSHVPRFTFQGDTRSMATILANDRFARSMISSRITIDLDDLPFRAIDLPAFDGLQPQLTLVFQGLRMWNVQDLQDSRYNKPELSVFEAGFRLSTIPVFFTSLFQAAVECTWSVDHHSSLQQPFRITFAITTPFSALE